MNQPKNYPKRGQVYTGAQISQLFLRDIPSLTVFRSNLSGPVQNHHITEEDMLGVPGFADSKWRYIRETDEWIPVFHFVEEQEIKPEDFLDIQTYQGQYDDHQWLWVTPKGYPRDPEK